METLLKELANPGALLDAAPSSKRLLGVQVGTLVAAEAACGAWVTCPALSHEEPLEARSTVVLTPEDVDRTVLLVFENGEADRPIITGLLREQPVAEPATLALDGQDVEEIRADDERICLEARKEIVLRCGQSSVTLRADGKIVIKGVELLSRARRTNKVKGATVQIN